MNLWGVTDKGYYCPTIDDIITEKNKKAKALFGQDFDTDEKSFAGKLFQTNAAAELKLCQIAEDIYYSVFPSTARGLSLDRVCEFVSLQREGEGSAVHKLKVYGEQDYVIPAGTLFKNSETGVEFYSTQQSIIDNEEQGQDDTFTYYADVEVQCAQSGEIGNTRNIDSLVEVDTNIYNVVYNEQISYGTPIESDPELREKFSEVVNGLGTSNDVAIKANVLRVSGVNDIIIIDNNTSQSIVISDDLTVASGTYAVIVHSDGMTSQNDIEIAKAIFAKQPFGILQCGTKSITVKDDSGVDHIVKFSYVTTTTVNVAIKIKTDSTFNTTDGVKAIEDNVTSYINNLDIGEEVVYSRLYDYIYNVTGVYKVTDITLNNTKTDIAIPKINIAKVGSINVTIGE